jgi:hypothetical protein
VLSLCFAVCLVVAWSCFSGSITPSGLGGFPSDIIGQSTSAPATAQASTSPAVPNHFFGFTPDFGAVDDTTLNAYYKKIEAGGTTWVRCGIYWWYIEKTPGTYTWYSADRFFAAGRLRGLLATYRRPASV